MIEFDEEKLDEYLNKHKNRLIKIFEDKDVLECINKNNFSDLYRRFFLCTEATCCITAVLLKSGIDFLSYLNHIPDRCFFGLPITKIEIPNNINYIDNCAFEDTYLIHTIIPKSVSHIGEYAFSTCDSLTTINYLGTIAQWKKIEKQSWKADSIIKQIICTDGNIIYKIYR